MEISGLTWVENTTNVLAGTLEFDTSAPVTLAITIAAEADGGAAPLEVTTPADAASSFEVRVLGLHASTDYTATITATDENGNETVRTVSFATKALPADFPPLVATISKPAQMQAGWTLVPVFRWNPAADPNWGYIVAVDSAGKPVWYTAAKRPADVKVLPSGNVLYNEGDDAAVEIDPAGKLVDRWTGTKLGTDTVHHEITPLPGGTFAALGTAIHSKAGYTAEPPASGTVTYTIVSDLAVEYDRAGTIVHEYDLFNVLDPLRVVRPDFFTPFWDAHYGITGSKDWTHGNAIIHDSRDDSFILSLRHQDWIIKIDRKTGTLKWKFGKDGDFAIEGGDANFSYHQHAPELGSDGHLLVYDNGNGRPGAATPATAYSRAVEYELDEGGDAGTNRTAKVVWEYRGAAPYFSQFVGDADKLTNGNVLVTDGGLVSDVNKGLQDPTNIKFSRVVEVTHTATPEEVFHLDVKDPAATAPVSYTVYRSIRIAPLK